MYPCARREDVQVRLFNDETLLYDRKHVQAHALNAASALVWKHCDGETPEFELRAIVARKMNIAVDEAGPLVELALEQLARRDLLVEALEPADRAGKIARRDMLKKLAIAAVAMPLIMSIKAPSAMAQLSVPTPTPCAGLFESCQSRSCCHPFTCYEVRPGILICDE